MTRAYHIWTKEQEDLLEKLYPNHFIEELLPLFPFSTVENIMAKIKRMGWKREKKLTKKNKIEKLLDDVPESAYWLGFLMADGTFQKRSISLTIHKNDKEHLDKFLKYIESTNAIHQVKNSNCYRVGISCQDVCNILKERFNLNTCKTYNPCSLDYFINKPDLFFSFIVGYLDGDGTVVNKNSSHYISIVGHSNWINNFSKMFYFIHNYFNISITSKSPELEIHYSYLPQDLSKAKKPYKQTHIRFTKLITCLNILSKARELNLPFMERKLGKFTK